MSETTINLGSLPVNRGAFSGTANYYLLNEVTMYGMMFRAKTGTLETPLTGYAPAQLNASGNAVLINTDKWELVAGTPDIYNEAARLTAVEAGIASVEETAEELEELYQALTQSDIIITDDHTQEDDPEQNKIYREPGTSSYADWMWNGTAWKKMAEYDNGVDDTPTEDSDNLAKSGGIWSWVIGLIDTVKSWCNSTFAKIDGWYKTLVAGAAENLVGHGAVGAEYTFRTSGGTADIGTGAATIDVLKGKTLKWQQKMDFANFTWLASGISSIASSYGIVDNVYKIVLNTSNSSTKYIYTENALPIVGHKYFYKGTYKANVATLPSNIVPSVSKGGYGTTETIFSYVQNKECAFSGMYTAGESGASQTRLAIPCYGESGDTIEVKISILIDLTDLFGAGNEPSTVAEFEALYPLDYSYTATPVLINNAAKGIVTTGFNQWDEEWEQGMFNEYGQKTTGMAIRAVNFIPVFPDTTYYIKNGSNTGVRILEYDINKQFIKTYGVNPSNVTKSFSSNCRFIKFSTATEYGTTYQNDICINLSWSGYRNGEYEPYEKHTLYFNGESGSLATVTGKKLVDGEPTGESVTIFPEGMKSAGSVYDFGKADSDGYIRKVTKVISSNVNLEDLSWTLKSTGTNNKGWSGTLPTGYNYIKTQILAANYSALGETTGALIESNGADSYQKNSIYTYTSSNDRTIYVITDVNSSPTGACQVALYTPEEYLLDTPIPATYIVNDFGTEQRIPEDTASSVMANISYTVQYSMNAVDELRRLGTNFIRKSSMDNILTALVTAGIIGSYTLTYNETDDDYDCSVTAPENPGE